MCNVCARTSQSRPKLHRGHTRMLRVAGALRSAGKALKDEGLDAEWQSVDAVKAAAERPVARAIQAVWRQQREEALQRVEQVVSRLGGAKAAQKDADALWSGALLDEARWTEVLKDLLGDALAEAVQEGFRAGGLRVDLDLSSGFQSSARTEQVLASVLDKTGGINQTTRQDLASAIRAGLERGESIDEISGRVAGYFDGIQEWRAQLIAQTSATPAFEAGQQEAFLSAGIDKNKWFSQRDGNVRGSHWDADGQVREIGKAFAVGDAQLEFPGDPQGPKKETIGCRCTLFPVRTREEEEKSAGGDWRAERNAAMRAAYPALRDDLGKWAALEKVGSEHGVSASTAEDIVYQKGHYSA